MTEEKKPKRKYLSGLEIKQLLEELIDAEKKLVIRR